MTDGASGLGQVGFVGLGNVGRKLAGSLLRNGVDLTVRDVDPAATQPFAITCLPSPAASAVVMETPDGLLAGWRPGTVWMEMSTTDNVIRRLEDATGVSVTAPGFPAELVDDETERCGAEVEVRGSA